MLVVSRAVEEVSNNKRQLVAGLPPQRAGFDTRSGDVEFVADKVAWAGFPNAWVSSPNSFPPNLLYPSMIRSGNNASKFPNIVLKPLIVVVRRPCLLQALSPVLPAGVMGEGHSISPIDSVRFPRRTESLILAGQYFSPFMGSTLSLYLVNR
jgi:hypothetical protein